MVIWLTWSTAIGFKSQQHCKEATIFTIDYFLVTGICESIWTRTDNRDRPILYKQASVFSCHLSSFVPNVTVANKFDYLKYAGLIKLTVKVIIILAFYKMNNWFLNILYIYYCINLYLSRSTTNRSCFIRDDSMIFNQYMS